MHRVSSPGATVQSGQSLSSKPFVWPGASDPPAGTLYNPRLLRTYVRLPVLLSRVHVAAKKLDAKEDLKQLSDQLREMKEDAFSNTVGCPLFVIDITHDHVTDAFHDPKRPNGEDKSGGLL